ncbi:hypothetical protein ASF77_21705 [Massilia sp. Leaf139]|nr:hypothetical protein ASF77_21705 [Massilia sp. Leaf139]
MRTLRFILFVLLSLAGRVVCPLARGVSACGLFVFLFLALFRRDLADIMWVAGGITLTAGLVSAGYDALIRLVAPEGVVVVSDI